MNVKVNINGTLKKQNEFICFIFQVKQRADECILALDKLTEINSGISVQNVLETHFDWSTLKVSFWLPLAVTCMQDSCHACMHAVCGSKHNNGNVSQDAESRRNTSMGQVGKCHKAPGNAEVSLKFDQSLIKAKRQQL